MIKHTLLSILLIGIVFIKAEANTPTYAERFAYIDNYSAMAVAEMYRSKIPASITLAQAILESSWGTGELALNGNNFFGIKCKSEWTGGTYYKKDDDLNAEGILIKSCFRTYSTIDESFIDHTDFLVNRPYYKACFDHDSADYFSWAVALQDAGYATAKDYALRLIDLIDKYQLHRFDKSKAEMNAVSNSLVQTPIVTPVSNETTYTNTVALNASTPQLTPPPVVDISNYTPEWKEAQLATRTGSEEEPTIPTEERYKVLPNTRETYRTQNNATQQKSTYKSHTRMMRYKPSTSSDKRR